MKNLIITLLLAVATLSAYAQTESEHLTFKGVPIDGPLNEFVEKMKGVGFKFIEKKDNYALLKGNFAGYNDCELFVICNDTDNTVNWVSVNFPTQEKWGYLETNYNNIKSMLTMKYGEPDQVTEKFLGSYTPTTDREKIIELEMDKCQWETTYSTPTGIILLKLAKSSSFTYFVLLGYSDNINRAAATSSAMDDL